MLTNERLEELIMFQRSRVANGDALSEYLHQRERDKLIALEELRTLRAQQRAGGDVVERINERFVTELGGDACGNLIYGSGIGKQIIAAELAPLYALLKACDEWMSHAENVIYGAEYSGALKKCDREGAAELRKEYNESLSASLDALLPKEEPNNGT